MLFNSIEFFLFLPLVMVLFFLAPDRHRWILLLTASFWFYAAWKPAYLILMLVCVLLNYGIAIAISTTADALRRKLLLATALVGSLGVLFFFKYYNFTADSVNLIAEYFSRPGLIPNLEILLPVGISFYTFQTLSYTIDVYQGRQQPERHLGIFALYVSFFPQLVAGPIERPENLLPQFRMAHRFDEARVASGLRLIAWGLFKKVVIADRLAVGANTVFNHPELHHGHVVIYATLLFGMQIYCDFSGYSDIAIGSSRMMGFDLMKNFERPYLSASVAEFWKRWHISLSTWFRDYVYIPLGGNKVPKHRWYFNLLITFLISGLWHGASWTFVAWGALHGAFLVLGIWLRRPREWAAGLLRLDRLPLLASACSIVFTFLLVHLAWIFFRANSMGDAVYLIRSIFLDGSGNPVPLLSYSEARLSIWQLGMSARELVIGTLAAAVLGVVELVQARWRMGELLRRMPAWLRWTCYYLLVGSIVFFGAFNSAQQFVYFQF